MGHGLRQWLVTIAGGVVWLVAVACGPYGAYSQVAAERKPLGKDEGYEHTASRVGFAFSEGWEVLGVRAQGPVTSLGLRHRKDGTEVTLYWSKPDQPISAETIGRTEWQGLEGLYGDKIGQPEPVTVRGKKGFRLALEGGPLGTDEPGLVGVVYVFAVEADGQWWKIKVRATAKGKDKLTDVVKLLDGYRW